MADYNEDPDQPTIHLDLVPFGNPLRGDNNEDQEDIFPSDRTDEIKRRSKRVSIAQGDDQNQSQIDNQMPNQTKEKQDNKNSNNDLQKQDDQNNNENNNNDDENDEEDNDNNKNKQQKQQQNNQNKSSLNQNDETKDHTKNEQVNQSVKDEDVKLQLDIDNERKYMNQNQNTSNENYAADNNDPKKAQIIQKKSTQKKIKKLMTTKLVQYFLIFLIALYTLLIFATLAIDDLMSKEDKEDILDKFQIIELCILFIFCVEIALTSYSQGIKLYFRDRWLLFDAIVIMFSIALVIVSFMTDFGDTYKSVSGSIRGIFRFLRIFLLLRKVQTFKKIKQSSKVSTHQEHILIILQEIREQFEEQKILGDIELAMEILKQNKIYEQNLQSADQQENEWRQVGKVNEEEQMEQAQLEKLQNKRKQKQSFRDKGFLLKYPMNTVPETCWKIMDQSMDDIKFNVFEFSKIAKGQELLYGMIYLFANYGFLDMFEIKAQTFVKFFTKIQALYQNNQYHTSLHAFDVAQTINYFMRKCKFIQIGQLTELEIASLYIATAIHDVGHPGLNNQFMISTLDHLALLYNDKAVLEMYHIATTYELLQDEEHDILSEMEPQDQKRVREIIIHTVLSTDMTRHFSDISKAKARLTAQDFEITGKDKMMCMEVMVHASDISNPIKQWDVCFEWTHRILEEFWNQGDKERDLNIPITYLCDRYTTNIAKSQTGFIDFVVRPLMEVVVSIIPLAQPIIDQMDQNCKSWHGKVEDYQTRLDRLNEIRQQNLFKLNDKKNN